MLAIMLAACVPGAVSAMDPVSAICFKVKKDAEVCICARSELEQRVGPSAFAAYAGVVARTLNQTGVPRAKAWGTALADEARFQGVGLDAFELAIDETGRQHTRAVAACGEQGQQSSPRAP
jgi:hypothetical protein